MKLPAFSLPDHTGQTWKNANLAGWTAIFAYPKALTSGCTTEAKAFRDLKKQFDKLGVQILGLSPDEVTRQAKFAAKESLNLPLLADPEKQLLGKLKVWVEKSMYGRKYLGVERSTFLVNPAGEIACEWRKVKVLGHAEEVLAKAKELISS